MVLVLINNIDEYLTKVGIDMGLDENVIWNVSGGQVKLFGYVYKLIVKYLMKCKLIKKRKYRFGKQNKVEYQ